MPSHLSCPLYRRSAFGPAARPGNRCSAELLPDRIHRGRKLPVLGVVLEEIELGDFFGDEIGQTDVNIPCYC